MKALLVAPYKHSDQRHREDFIPSLALLSLASSLRSNGHQPFVLDFNSSKTHHQENPRQYCLDRISEVIDAEDIDLVGINCLFSGFFPVVLEMVTQIKKSFPAMRIAIGGIHPTTYPREILENVKEIDYVVLGEGESQLIALASMIDKNDFSQINEINSFAYRDQHGSVHIDKTQNLLDFDSLPMPAWDLVNFTDFKMDLQHFYNPKNLRMENIIPILSERGCPYHCNFCDMFVVMGRKLRRKTATAFVDELELLNKEFGQTYFAFMDDNLILDKKHILAICHEIKSRGLNIQFDTTGGINVNAVDEEIIETMVDAGMISATIAPEHGNDYIRNDIIKKMLPRHRIYEVAEILKRYDIQIGANWIMGFPEETNETLQDTYDMINELELDRNAIGVVIPFPGTTLFKQVMRDNLFVEKFDKTNLWRTPIVHVQSEFPLKPYNMEISELQEWKNKFLDLRYKFFGRRNASFAKPRDDMAGRIKNQRLPHQALSL